MNADWLDTFIDETLETGVAARRAAPHTEFADFSVSREAGAALRQVLLGYSPIIDARWGVFATRLTVVPSPSTAAVHAGALLDAIAEVWPGGGGIVSLNIGSETLLRDLLRSRPADNTVIEVPAFMASDPANADALRRLAARGNALVLKGRPLQPLPREVLPCFRWSLIDLADERRAADAPAPAGVHRGIPHIQAGVRSMAELQRSFALGAVAVIGWPLHEPVADALQAQPDARVVLDALHSIDVGDPADATHHVLMRDPVLAYELLRHTATREALSVETLSMSHAVSMLGQSALRRWLGSVLARSNSGGGLRPANFAALRRGLLMRMLAAPTGQQEQRGELFMCGVFSLLDRVYARPLGELAHRLALPEAVRAALVERSGPYAPLLELARAVESEVPHDIRAASEAVFVEPIEINRALLRSLLVASRLEQPREAARVP